MSGAGPRSGAGALLGVAMSVRVGGCASEGGVLADCAEGRRVCRPLTSANVDFGARRGAPEGPCAVGCENGHRLCWSEARWRR